MDTFPAPAGGASESKQLQQRYVLVLSEKPQCSRAEPLCAWCQEKSLSRKAGIRAGTRRRGVHTIRGQKLPQLLSIKFSPNHPLAKLRKNSSWIFTTVKLLIYKKKKKMLLQMGKSPRNHARDSLGQILLLGITSPYYRSSEGCLLARGLLLMNFAIQNWLREHKSDFANQSELIILESQAPACRKHTRTHPIFGG